MGNSRRTHKLVLLSKYLATTTGTTSTYTPGSALNHNQYSKIIIDFKFQLTATLALNLKLNGITAYWEEGFTIIAGTLAGYNNTSQAVISITSTATAGANIIVSGTITIYLPDSTMAGEKMHTYSTAVTSKSAIQTNACAIGISSGSLSSIEILVSTSSWMAGSSIDIYGVKI